MTSWVWSSYVIADKGYSSAAFDFTIRRQYKATPIIDAPSSHKKRLAKRDKTGEWVALYRIRGAVERAFSRLKGQRALNKITVRGKGKVTAHCFLSLIALQVSGLASNSKILVVLGTKLNFLSNPVLFAVLR